MLTDRTAHICHFTEDWYLDPKTQAQQSPPAVEPQPLKDARADYNRKKVLVTAQYSLSTVAYLLINAGIITPEMQATLAPLGNFSLLMLASALIEAQLKVMDLEKEYAIM